MRFSPNRTTTCVRSVAETPPELTRNVVDQLAIFLKKNPILTCPKGRGHRDSGILPRDKHTMNADGPVAAFGAEAT
ncbi:MAG: hypothetical protein DWI29_02440 [Planctomycetota bacterium]|nr:MAG: hypothetical protein DWI29_02440 [Planctomycetota bacterium]